jgi:hypothetical protein
LTQQAHQVSSRPPTDLKRVDSRLGFESPASSAAQGGELMIADDFGAVSVLFADEHMVAAGVPGDP